MINPLNKTFLFFLNQMLLYSPVDQLRRILGFKFLQQVLAMGIYRKRTEKQFLRNRSTCFALGHHLEDFFFPFGKSWNGKVILRWFADDLFGLVTEHNISGKCPFDAYHQLIYGGIFQKITAGPVLYRLHDDTSFRTVAEHDNGRFWRYLFDFPAELCSIGIRQGDIQKDNIYLVGTDKADDLRAGSKAFGNIKKRLAFQHHFKPFDDNGMIIYNNDIYFFIHHEY